MIPKVVRFSIGLLFLLMLALWLHIYIIESNNIVNQNLLLSQAYLTNYLLVLVSYLIILIFFKKQNFSLGFIFMAGFLVKMAVFMIFFNPVYKLNGSIETAEFFAFFTPYIICLITETISLVRILNKS